MNTLPNNVAHNIWKFIYPVKDIQNNKIDDSLESYWTTPVNLSIKECSKLYKANYSSLKSIEEIENKLDENLDTKGLNIIEIECDYKNTQKIEAEINNEF